MKHIYAILAFMIVLCDLGAQTVNVSGTKSGNTVTITTPSATLVMPATTRFLSGGVLNWDAGDLTLTHTADTLTLAGGSFTLQGGLTINGGATAFSDGHILTFNSGDVTVTHSANALTVNGGQLFVPTSAYNATTWNGSLAVPTQDAVRDVVATLATLASPTFTGTVTIPTGGLFTAPQITTSITTDSTTFALLNTTATTVNAFGAATTVNTGASATQIWNFGGSTTASEFRFLEPSGSGTNYTSLKAAAQSANITYIWPATIGTTGQVLQTTTSGTTATLSWVDQAAGSGSVATDTIFDAAGDLVQGTGANTSARLAIGTAGQLLQVNSGATAAEWTSAISATAVTAGTLEFEGSTADANETTVAVTDPTADRTFTIPNNTGTAVLTGATVAQTTDLGGDTSFEIPNAAAPTVDAFGEIAGDNNLWAASRGTAIWFDGTAATAFVNTLVSDTPTNGQVPKWNTGGTITWEDDNNSGSNTAFDAIGDPSGAGTIAFGATQQLITSTIDTASNIALEISNTDADAANANIILKLSHNDGADAEVTYLAMVGDKDGTPTNDFLFNQSTGFTSLLPATATSFTVTGSTVPANGSYLPAASTVGWAANSAAEMQLTATALSPAADGGNSLGTTALGWQNLFGNTGFVLNIENANWRATHTSGILTIDAGELRITSANVGTNADSVPTQSSTNTLTNKTLDASATGNVVKLKGYIYLTHPHFADGTGAVINTTATAITYGHATFSNSADKAANYVEYLLQVPEDIDTSVALRGRLKVLIGADTNDQNWLISSVSVADSAVPGSATLANEIALDYTADASGANGDVETTAWTTLTSWAGALTAGQTWRIRLMRDGDTSDASTVNSTELGLVIEYGITQ